MLASARNHIQRAMIIDGAVPIVMQRNEMVAAAIKLAMGPFSSDDMHAQVPTSATKEIIGAMSAVRRAFKQHAFSQINQVFGLRSEGSPTSRITYRKERVRYLLKDFNFLRDLSQPQNEPSYFTTPFFQHFMINMLFLTPMKLWQHVQDGCLDTTFALGATAIAAALGDFWKGYYCDVDAKADNWREQYTKAIDLISLMRSKPDGNEWLTRYQQCIITHGKAELPPVNL